MPSLYLHSMSFKLATSIVTVLFIASIIIGMYSIFATPEVKGFTDPDLHAPMPFTARQLPAVPATTGSVQTSPDVTINLSVGQIYEDYGGSIRLTIHNRDTRPLFLIDVGFEWVGTLIGSVQEVHQEMQHGEEVEIRALTIDAPAQTGSQAYRIKIRVLEERAQGWFRVMNGGDEWLYFGKPGEYKTIMVHSLPTPVPYDQIVNQYHYYQKANELVNFDSLSVELAANIATVGLGSTYNIGKVCAIFDYVDDTITYTEDSGGDIWYAPEVCLSNKAGDCEDYSLLISTMVHDAGGTARTYLTSDHAFAAVYVGNTSAALSRAREGILDYYGADLDLHTMMDETGYWIIADPLGSFHLGGLAVGAIPSGSSLTGWNLTFEDTDTIHVIDITGEVASLPFWLNTQIWLVLVLVFGIVDIALILIIAAEKDPESCHVCKRPAAKGHYKCSCGVGYHHECLPSRGYCLGCGAPIEHPPPLSPPGIRPGY